jgi:hypothetical protein
MLVNYHTPITCRPQQNTPPILPATYPPDIGAPTFAQAARSTTTNTSAAPQSITMGSDGVTHDGITCFDCQSTGQYANNCPKARISLLQFSCVLTQSSQTTNCYQGIPTSCILLDSQSNISVFNNANMISNIRRSTEELCAHTNGGTQISTQVGDFTNLGTVWYNPDSIANILSLSDVRQK